ncbi:MAG: Ribosomal RNA small subunit methyltransferase I [Chloroflexi bacterium ADurb.Bin120]|jgi:16S rRNA (cytidine1402-2'-O)-methyltransferase|uniref:Ribosomal RNA small subunit methyltransferase I n=1 Tax=Candidatus Brevifilum fermentans TaxID=1986204 RepID=A0A1Y6K5B0_9CHLR|nr:16S rRNA (cytidine(1402)-2'-O)-methyltransferase [Brevefilum fermentans]MDI9566887.1 16S rRNA (cytidine(1402)-2'-O)-methyltransferase [Chloroflexota bacterium]OQB87929.1 MAG: Ribosomal RNA small subunit methyltransferase I [Chloroflexi bacterium ADurb.Bin120]SMX54068.1 Ribosomal RNA small subunit methyltransferase I [Brevefilum fermentans]
MLYLVATPIGNLGDITLRALDVLRCVDLIASEDTRKTSILLGHYNIHKPQKSYHAFNEEKVVPKLVDLLLEGQSIAVVSSAGTPGISDPGYSLVQAAIAHGIPVTAIPGPSALVLALTLSGLPGHSFTYKGFPPRKSAARRRFISVDAESPHTLIFYESPHRVRAFLADALAVLGDRQAALANDLTKKFESLQRGRLSELLETFNQEAPRGEYTVLIEGAR